MARSLIDPGPEGADPTLGLAAFLDVMDVVGPVLMPIAIAFLGFSLWPLWTGRLRRSQRLPYVRHDCLNSPAEQHFVRALQRAVGDQYTLAYKVRLADVMTVKRRRRHPRDQRWWRWFRPISSKHVDVVVCDPAGGRMYVAIELDDRSHQRRDRRRRDAFVDQAFASAGLPLIRVRAQRHYDVSSLRQQLAEHLPLLP
ncbi:DUF2726 domain-containing protein [Halomonas elongata]|uniref:DUF2726 domain-containing protein n=1 Tax=Halomonas elongata (strain ATCC 33173 / DSM 2581 / NBRC 15536 / NCIMB 2198 / 1H9) TaxID=768066 RepID=E1VA59_HALED|nr:DUF2726 domain-containing protein [Halomonas elongata]WBF17688.1 DUF2726 domain-containing protein [Halomonas elongata]WPU46529.1 DUF2726 domain-containing protein [Halomonas elongata DSM 2581]CBV43947.1 DUF2726 family protein [Halomonas elongata DSM 2581]